MVSMALLFNGDGKDMDLLNGWGYMAGWSVGHCEIVWVQHVCHHAILEIEKICIHTCMICGGYDMTLYRTIDLKAL